MYSLKIVIVWRTVLIILVYTQIFTFSVRLLFVTRKSSKKKCDIVVYENGSDEDIAHARTTTLLYTSFTVTMSQSNMTVLLLNHNNNAKIKPGASELKTQLENHHIFIYVNIHCVRKIYCAKFYALELYRFPVCKKTVKLQEVGV